MLAASPAARADQDWDGDNTAGNFTYDNNWYGDSQPAWGFANGNLNFNFNNGSQSSLFYDYGFYQNTNDIFFKSTYPSSITWNGDGNGINFNQRFENDSTGTITLGTMNLSGGKNGATQIELNPVGGNLVINGNIFNDNSLGYHVYGANGKTLTLNSALGVGGTASNVSFTLEQASNVVNTAAQAWTGATNINAGTFSLGTGGSLASGSAVNVASGAQFIFNHPDAFTVANVISGAGVVNQNGIGTTTLTAANAYTGATNINAGALALGTGGSLASGSAVNVASGAQFIFNRSDAFTVANVISGAGTLTQSGTGTTTLTGANTSFTGATNINAGGITIGSGGSLGSIGTRAGAVTAGSGGTFTVDGGSLYATSLGVNNGTSPAIASLINGGTINLSGNLAIAANNSASSGSLVSLINGTLSTNSVTIGRTGIGLNGAQLAGSTTNGLYVNGATVNVATTLSLGTSTGTNSNANFRMDSGSTTVGGLTTVTSNNSGRPSFLDVNGGTFTAGTGGIQLGGTFAGSAGQVLVRGTGVLNTSGIAFGTSTQTSGTDTLTLLGGTLYVGSGGLTTGYGGSTTSAFFFGGGTLAASATWASASAIPISLSGDSTIKAADASGNAFNIILNGPLTNTSGANRTLTLSGGGTTMFVGNIALSNSATSYGLTFAGAGNAVISGNITNGGTSTASGIVSNNTGTLTLTGANTYGAASGVAAGANTIINAGTVRIGNVSALGVGRTALATGATIDLNGSNLTTAFLENTASLSTGTVDNVSAGGNVTLTVGTGVGGETATSANYLTSGSFNGSIKNTTGTVNLTKVSSTIVGASIIGTASRLTGPSVFTLTGTNTYTGSTAIKGGFLQLLPQGSTGLIASTSPLVLQGGGLVSINNTGISPSQTFASTTLNAGASQVSPVRQSNTTNTINLGAITRNVGSTLNFYDRPGGGSSNALLGAADGTATTTTANTGGILGGYAVSGGSSWAVGGGTIASLASYSATLATGTNVDVPTAGLTGGGLTVNSLRFLNSTASTTTAPSLTLTGNLNVTTGGILTVGGASGTATSGATTNASITGNFNLTSGNVQDLIFITNNLGGTGVATMSVSANIANSGATSTGLTKSGAGTLTLTPATANTFTGQVTINAGNLILGNVNALNGNNILFGGSSEYHNIAGLGTVIQNGTLTLNGSSTTVGSLTSSTDSSGTAIVQNASANASTLTVSGATSATYAGLVQNGTGGGTLALVKGGANTQTLTNANTYTGTTTVSGGTLLINGNQTAATGNVSVATGGTLGGTGTVGGATTVDSGGTITGNANGTVGTLTIGNALTINGTYLADLSGAVSDTLGDSAGTLTLGNTSVLNIAVSGTLTAAQYVLATYASLSGTFGSVLNLPAGYMINYGTGTSSVITLEVPEPTTWLGGLLLTGVLGYSMRRRYLARAF